MSKSSGRPSQMGSANNLPAHAGTCPSMGVGREEQKEEEVSSKVNYPSSHPSSCHVNFAPLMQSFPMCGPTSMPGVMCHLNPAAQEFLPRPPGGFNWGPAWQQSSLQQACYPPQAWLRQPGFFGVELWLCTPSVGPAFGVAMS